MKNQIFPDVKTIHFVGIKGVAMTSLALWAKEAGYLVSGSDVADEFPTDALLKKANIVVLLGFSADHVHADLVIYTGAHGGQENIEVVTAQSLGILALPHGKALGIVMADKKQISVAGCHGKTTTTAMIATILVSGGMDPSYAIGSGEIRGLGNPSHAGRGAYFIAEADEYVTDPTHDPTPRFLWQHPDILVVTNVDYDHPDVYSSLESVQSAYQKLALQLQGEKICVMNADDQNSQCLQSIPGIIRVSCGYTSTASFIINRQKISPDGNSFVLRHGNQTHGPFTLHLPGSQNILNAAAAILAAQQTGMSDNAIEKGLQQFGGAKRRFERIGSVHGAEVYDDYAHHPTEIAATIEATREWYPTSRIITVFQPHTYSRTKSLLSQFGEAFSQSDVILLLPIYSSAREIVDSTISSDILKKEIGKHRPVVETIPSYEALKDFLFSTLKEGDILLFLGAGDIGITAERFVRENQSYGK